MKKLKIAIFSSLTFIFIASSLFFLAPKNAAAAVRVRSYIRSNGIYVAPHYRSNSDNTKYNNWSTKGNYNPYTGKKGTKIIR
jgi:hypothetical protein